MLSNSFALSCSISTWRQSQVVGLFIHAFLKQQLQRQQPIKMTSSGSLTTMTLECFFEVIEAHPSAKTKIIRQVHFGRQVRQEVSGSVGKCQEVSGSVRKRQEQRFPSDCVRSGIWIFAPDANRRSWRFLTQTDARVVLKCIFSFSPMKIISTTNLAISS